MSRWRQGSETGIPRAHWPGGAAKPNNYRFRERPCHKKIRWWAFEGDAQHQTSGLLIHTRVHTCVIHTDEMLKWICYFPQLAAPQTHSWTMRTLAWYLLSLPSQLRLFHVSVVTTP